MSNDITATAESTEASDRPATADELMAAKTAAEAQAAAIDAELRERRAASDERYNAARKAHALGVIQRARKVDETLQLQEHASREQFKQSIIVDHDFAGALAAFIDYRGHRIARYTTRSAAIAAESTAQTGASMLPDSDRLIFDGGEFLTEVGQVLSDAYGNRSAAISEQYLPEPPSPEAFQ